MANNAQTVITEIKTGNNPNKKGVVSLFTPVLLGYAMGGDGPAFLGSSLILYGIISAAKSFFSRQALSKTACAALACGALTLAALKGVVMLEKNEESKLLEDHKKTRVEFLAKNTYKGPTSQDFSFQSTLINQTDWGLEKKRTFCTLSLKSRSGGCLTLQQETRSQIEGHLSPTKTEILKYCSVPVVEKETGKITPQLIQVLNY